MKSDLRRFGRGFVYAWNGICAAVRQERNVRFHLCAALYVYLAAWLAGLDRRDVALLSLCIFGVIGMELMNSAVERAVDKPDTGHWWSAGAAKDMAAGAVLVCAVGALCVGFCLFGTKQAIGAIWNALMQSPATVIALAASVVAAFFFVFRFDTLFPNKSKDGNDDTE
ncbi:MAG: diacylglycerol kinase family protein [Gemmiger sp.]